MIGEVRKNAVLVYNIFLSNKKGFCLDEYKLLFKHLQRDKAVKDQ